MSQFVFVRPGKHGTLGLADVGKVADNLKLGALAVLPSETGYMVAAMSTCIPAVVAAFKVKKRPAANVMHVACSSLRMVETVGTLNSAALRLLGAFTPGPLSVIVRKTSLLPDHLVTLNGTVGIRVPDNIGTLQIITEVGVPVTATSLNAFGEAKIDVTEDALSTLNWPDDQIVYVLEDSSAQKYDASSTLVRVTGDEVEILRVGPVGEHAVRRVAASIGYLETSDWT